jgi:hypothetical protein
MKLRKEVAEVGKLMQVNMTEVGKLTQVNMTVLGFKEQKEILKAMLDNKK